MKEKVFKTLAEQAAYLQEDKAIVFSDVLEAQKVLLDTNYYNIISCGKVKFVKSLINNDKHVYQESDFREWVDYFSQDCIISEYLMKNVIRLERIINSRLAYYLSELIEKNKLTDNQHNDLIQKINSFRKVKDYPGKKTWVYVTQMTLGEMKEILIWIHKHHEETYHKITKGYDFLRKAKQIKARLDELNHLRNNLFHFRPLNIYLVYGRKPSDRFLTRNRKTIINNVLNINYNITIKRSLDEIYQQTDKFIAIKNSQCKSID